LLGKDLETNNENSHFYAIGEQINSRFWTTADKHVPVEMNMHTTKERCFWCCPCRELIKKRIGVTSSVEGWQLSWALQGRLRRDGAILEWVWLSST
jgi:hypothetical protein